MKEIDIFLVLFCFCSGLNAMRTDDPSSQELFRSMNRRITPRIVCVTNEHPLPLLHENDVMLDKLCTDVLYRIPLSDKFSDWEHSLHHSDPLADYRQRYPNIGFHVSVPDFFLMTTSSTEMARLVAYLVKMQADSLDVVVSPETNLGVLYHVLLSYKDILPPGKQLSISISELDPHNLVKLGIIDIVHRVYALPSYSIEVSTQMSAFLTHSSETSIREFARRLIEIGIPSYKLVMGLPSTIVTINNPSVDLSTIPPTQALCSSVRFSEWTPKRSSPRDQPYVEERSDGYVWENPHQKWNFLMTMGVLVTNNVDHLLRMRISGIGISDLTFKRPVNPICSWHKDNFVQSVYQAIHPESFSYLQHLSDEELATVPRWREMDGRLGKILVYGQQQDEDSYVNYFNITDDNTLLASPLDHIVLGYNDDGHVFNIYKSTCQPSHANSDGDSFLESLNYLVKRYSLENVIRGATDYRSLLPPSVLIFPESLPINSPTGRLSALLHPQLIPKLITWFKIRPTYPARPERPYDIPIRFYSMWDRPYGMPDEYHQLRDVPHPYNCQNVHSPEKLGGSKATVDPDQITPNDTETETPAETIENPPTYLGPLLVENDSTNAENVITSFSEERDQFESMLDILSSLNISNDTSETSQLEDDPTKHLDGIDPLWSDTNSQDVTTQRPDISEELLSSSPVPNTVAPRWLRPTTPNWHSVTPYAFNIEAAKTVFDEAYQKIRNALAKLG